MSYRNPRAPNNSNAFRTVSFTNPSPLYTPQSSSRSPSSSVAAGKRVSLAQDSGSDRNTIHADEALNNWDADQDEMEDRRTPLHRPADGCSAQPLLLRPDDQRGRPGYDDHLEHGRRPSTISRRSRMASRSPDTTAKLATRKKYTYAAFFLVLSLVAFTVQTETAEYIQHDLGWNKAYCMLYVITGPKFYTPC